MPIDKGEDVTKIKITEATYKLFSKISDAQSEAIELAQAVFYMENDQKRSEAMEILQDMLKLVSSTQISAIELSQKLLSPDVENQDHAVTHPEDVDCSSALLGCDGEG